MGTTFTAAAVRRDGRTEVVQLGSRGAAIPSVLLLREDGDLLTGDTARRRAVSEPDRVATEFKRRVGDPVPVLVGGSPFAAEALVARLLRWVVDTVVEREGGPPAGIGVTHPANWGPYKLDLLTNAIRTAGLERVTFLSEPAAAARHYAAQARVPDGAVVAVYDLGGGTFDACVLRKQADGSFELLGQPEGIERLGGIDLDEAVLGHVRRAADDLFEGLDADDSSIRAALSHLRDECTAAKEQLSHDVDATIPVLIPGRPGRDVRITRAEFEGLVRPVLVDTIGSVERSLRSAGVTAQELHAVLLVGGSSRVPLVGQLVATGLGRPVAVDADPKLAVAQGAALAAEAAFPEAVVIAPAAAPDPVLPDLPPVAVAPTAVGAAEPAAATPPIPPPPDADPAPLLVPEPASAGGGRRRWALLAAALVLVAAAVGGFLLFGGDDGDGGEDDLASDETTTTTPTTTTVDETTTTTEADELDEATSPFPEDGLPFVHISGIELVDGAYEISFETNFPVSPAEDGFTPERHVHFFYDVDDRASSGDVRAQAGTNGDPEPCRGCWLAYGGLSPVVDESLFTPELVPDGASQICALVATAENDPSGAGPHEIADVDDDGAPDPDTGNCAPLPA